VAYYEREQRELVRLNYVEPVRSPLSASFGEALGYVGYFAELIDEWAPEAHADERLYRLGASVLEALAAGVPVEALARYFEYWLLRLQGCIPRFGHVRGAAARSTRRRMPPASMRCCSAGPARSRRRHALVGGGARVSEGGAGGGRPNGSAALALSPRAARELETAHRRLLMVHLDKELKSVRVLRDMRRPARRALEW
jgi:hypothetical protein